MPFLEEQAEIVRRVEALFALADRIQARCTAARARAEAQRLTPLALAKTFRGELIPQDHNDEPFYFGKVRKHGQFRQQLGAVRPALLACRDLCAQVLHQRGVPLENRVSPGDFDPGSDKIKVHDHARQQRPGVPRGGAVRRGAHARAGGG